MTNEQDFFSAVLFHPFISSFALLFLASNCHSCVNLSYWVGTWAQVTLMLARPISSDCPFLLTILSLFPVDGALSIPVTSQRIRVAKMQKKIGLFLLDSDLGLHWKWFTKQTFYLWARRLQMNDLDEDQPLFLGSHPKPCRAKIATEPDLILAGWICALQRLRPG